MLQYCSEHSSEIHALVAQERERFLRKVGGQIVLRMEHRAGSGNVQIPVFNIKTNKDTLWTISPYHDSVQALLVRKIPRAYYIPKENNSIIELLNRHHILMKSLAPQSVIEGEAWSIDSIGTEVLEEETTAHAYVTLKNVRVTADPGDMLVPLEQEHSLFLSTFLEPESMWGVFKYKDFLDNIRRTGKYPVIRISH